MTRSLAVTLVAFSIAAAALAQPGAIEYRADGKFTEKDPTDKQRKGPMQVHTVKLKAGKTYIIDMTSDQVDSYLRLLDEKGKQLDEDDDSGGGQNAQIVFNCTRSAAYQIVCTTFAENMRGSYKLTVKVAGAVAAAPSGHARLLGKPAPDFRADFATIGQAGKLSELRGKVVLLYFCDMRSSPCGVYLPHLNRWQKEYEPKGLAVRGVTFYPSDIGQPLSFNAETGKLVSAAKADHQSDQALLRAYAAHHKVEHPLLVLTKDDALSTNDAYVVNGVPQTVLIDRKGIVRAIDVGGEKTNANVENEIKKLVAEK